jgi:hypothetical protein
MVVIRVTSLKNFSFVPAFPANCTGTGYRNYDYTRFNEVTGV